ncbi:MAG: hypothetical protein WKF84_19410 [Pyrinomonadaceae bacterium]
MRHPTEEGAVDGYKGTADALIELMQMTLVADQFVISPHPSFYRLFLLLRSRSRGSKRNAVM